MPNTGATNEASRVLIYVREDRLGDALLRLPAIASLRQAFPDSHITWLAGCGRSVLARGLRPLVAGALDRVEDGVFLGRSWAEWWRRPALDGHYGVIIDTQTVLRSSLLLRRVPHDLFISPAARFLLSDRRPGAPFGGSVQARLLGLIGLAAGRELQPDPRLDLPGEYRQEARRLLPPGPTYVGLAPGAGGRDKCWPLQAYLDLARVQRDRGRTPVFLLGPEEADWLPRIREQLPGALVPEYREDLALPAGPLLALALARRLAAGVANDAGAGHLMAAGGCPLVSLFGRTSVDKFRQPGRPGVVLRARDVGRGAAVASIPLAAVDRALEGLLPQGGAGAA